MGQKSVAPPRTCSRTLTRDLTTQRHDGLIRGYQLCGMVGLNGPNGGLGALRVISSSPSPSIPCYLPAVAINERRKRPQKIIVFQIIEHHSARCGTSTVAVYENTGVFLIHKSQRVLICPQHISLYSHPFPGRRPLPPPPPLFQQHCTIVPYTIRAVFNLPAPWKVDVPGGGFL